MKRIWTLNKRQSKAALFTLGALALLLVVGFQNCSKVGFEQAKDSLLSFGDSSQYVYTDLNTPKTFKPDFTLKPEKLVPTFEGGAATLTLDSGSTLKLAGTTDGSVIYTPATGFRGTESTTIYLKDNYGEQLANKVTFVVANPLHALQPAMAIRTPGCISCHANVASSFITDFGAGNDYFFAKSYSAQGINPLQGAGVSMYSDRMSGEISWMTAKFGSSVIVPKVKLGFDLAGHINSILIRGGVSSNFVAAAQAMAAKSTAENTLFDYVNAAESSKSPTTASGHSPALSVVEKDSVYIGAPNEALLIARTKVGSELSKFFKNSNASPELAGLVDKGSYFEAQSLTCDGDLVVQKPIYLNNLVLRTDSGCRIYATKSIFVNGPIQYEQITPGPSNETNLQLVSSFWINFGVARHHCESASNPGWYQQNNPGSNPIDHRLDSYGAPTREAQTPAQVSAMTARMKSELALIAGFKDASCEAGAKPRVVGYDRLLLNAPRVDSRYTGQFKGVLISEIALFGLSSFAYTYDPVFSRVAVLPFLEVSDYLKVE